MSGELTEDDKYRWLLAERYRSQSAAIIGIGGAAWSSLDLLTTKLTIKQNKAT
jgi:hypothetical protein